MKKLLIACLLGSSLSLGVQASDEHAGHHGAVQTEAAMSQGEVRRIDLAGGKITLRHGPIANLGMPPMSMVFKVQNAEQGSALQAGMKVRFRAEQQQGTYVLTHISPAP